MKRQRRLKKARLPQFVVDIRDFLLPRAANILVAFALLLVTAVFIKAFLYKSDYFRLKSIDTRNCFLEQRSASYLSSQLLNSYKGRNVFGLNLKGIASTISGYYPDARDVAVRLAPPDKLVISMRFRKPVAVVLSGQSYPIDEEGYVLAYADPASLKELPAIEGVGIKSGERRLKKSLSRNIQLALELLREIRRSRFMSSHKVDIIRAGDIRNLSFVLRNGPEIRIGFENFRQRLGILEDTLRDPRLLLDRIDYIDVRFKDVVIGPK